ncbi:treacle protein isoform X3 [Falco biarmicus]|uniref:treacle protein isoform X3 n=1 Tax=Falco rusticolus TaxID=120794 RepID=UPI00188650D2|nr:treacle protein isoform X3 [Falco rusticolus]XP_055575440.1 treacle protein isoform X3 [Falco cherrug]XP_056206496.1 treacle protein isoform X3 [Falco biarmicus]
MAVDGRGGRELLALIHQHLLRGGYARAARELQAQTGQKLLPSLATSLEDIFTHWEKTPSNSRRRKVSDEEAAIPEKIRVPDPVSSSESSEKEDDEKEKAKAANAASLSLATNSVVNVESTEGDDSSSEDETPAGKGAVTVTPAVVTGKAANSLRSPNKPAAPAGKTAVLPAANRTVVSNKQQPNVPAVSAAPAKAGQKLPSPGKPRQTATAVAKVGQSKAPVMTKAPESSSSSSSSSSSESEEEKEMPTAKAPAPKVELKQAAGAAESSSEESSDETSSEEEPATPAVQVKPAVKSAPAAPVSLRKNAPRQVVQAPNQAKPASTTVPGPAKPDDTSESSDSSDSEDEELPSITQTKPPPKTPQAIPPRVKPTPAASPSGKVAPAKTLPAPKPTVPKQAKTTPGKTTAPVKPAEGMKSEESSDSLSSEEEDLPVPVSQKRLTEQPGPLPNPSQAAKARPPEKAVGSILKTQASESGSSDSSDSEEESPAAQTEPPQAVETNAVPQSTNVKTAPAPAPAPPPVDSSDDSSQESDSEEEIVPPSQSLSQQNVKAAKVLSTVTAKANATLPLGKGIKAPAVPPVSRVSENLKSDALAEEVPTLPCLKQTVPVGKASPANTATPQAASLLGSHTAKSRKPGLQPAQDAQLSQAALPTQAEETSGSSSSSDSSDEEMPKQPPKPAGSLQKPGGTQPAHSSSLESSEEKAMSQSLLTGYMGLSKPPAAPQAPKTVPPESVGKARQGKAAMTAANSLTQASAQAAPANSSSSDSSDSDTDIDQVAANHKAENNPAPGQEATGASNKEKVAGKTEPGHDSLKPSPVKALAVKENDVGAKGVQVTPASHALLSISQSEEPSSGSKTEVTTARVPAVQTPEGLEVKKKKKEKKEKKEKKKPSSTEDKAVKASKSKDKENKKQKTSQKRKLPEEDEAVGQPKKKWKAQANEEVPKKKKKKAGDLEKLPGSKEKKKSAKKQAGAPIHHLWHDLSLQNFLLSWLEAAV